MKKTVIKSMWMIAVALIASVSLFSCNDKDEPKGDAEAIAGVYSGSAKIHVQVYDCGDMDFDVKIEAETDGTATVTLPQCTFTVPGTDRSHTIVAVPVHGVKVTESNNVYNIYIKDYSETIDGVTYTGNIEGKIAGKDAVIEYVIRPGIMPMDINFAFTGSAK